MRTPYYEVYLMQGMCSQTLKKCKRKETAENFAKKYEAKYGIKPMITVVASEWYEVARILIDSIKEAKQ